MAKSMGHFRDSRALSWLSGPRTDAPDEPPLKGPTSTLDSVIPVLYPSIDTI
jgi:hypothetical protein